MYSPASSRTFSSFPHATFIVHYVNTCLMVFPFREEYSLSTNLVIHGLRGCETGWQLYHHGKLNGRKKKKHTVFTLCLTLIKTSIIIYFLSFSFGFASTLLGTYKWMPVMEEDTMDTYKNTDKIWGPPLFCVNRKQGLLQRQNGQRALKHSALT